MLTLLAVVANSAVAYVFMVFTLSYGSEHLHYDKQFLILSVTAAAVLWFAAIPVWSAYADRHSRRTMFIAGSAAVLVWCVVFFPLLNTGSSVLAVVALAGMGLIIPVTHCVQGSIIADTFPARVRYSGSSLILQSGAILGGGLAPVIATALLNSRRDLHRSDLVPRGDLRGQPGRSRRAVPAGPGGRLRGRWGTGGHCCRGLPHR